VISHLTEKMDAASNQKAYEKAAYYRDQIRRLRKLQAQQTITGDEGNIDVLAVVEKMGQVAVGVLFVRGGRVIGHKVFYPKIPKDTEFQTLLLEFIPQYYLSPARGDEAVDQVILSEKLPEKLWVQNALREKLGKGFVITDRKKAEHRQWLLIAKTNAAYGLAQHIAQQNTVIAKLEALQKALKFPNPVQRIECFDVSHTKGEATIASCVVYGADGPQNKEYRRFNIKDVTPGDDYAALRQAIKRRYTRLKEGEGYLPDLLIIDGGKGQLRQAIEVLEEIQVSGVELMAVAKGPTRKPGLEKIFLPGKGAPIHLAKDDIALHLIQFIRDEAHRFAITAHRAKREKARSQSPFGIY